MKSLRWSVVHFEELMAGLTMQMVLNMKLHIIKGLKKEIVHWKCISALGER